MGLFGIDWEKATDVVGAAFPVMAVANGIGDIGDQAWGTVGLGGPVNSVLGGNSPFSGPGGEAPTAAGLSPEQIAAAQAAGVNPSAQRPVTGLTTNTTYKDGPLGTKIPVVSYTPTYGESVRDQAMTGFQAGPREAPQAQGAQAATAQMTAPANVTGATIDRNLLRPGEQTTQMGLGMTRTFTDASAQGRRDQSAQTARLTTAAEGLVPSVAENQLRSGLAQGLQSNLALAASNRGSGSGAVLAQRQAQDANTALTARTNAQAAQLRAGEMAQARGELTQQLAGVRGQDIQTAGLGTGIAGVGVQQQGIGAQLGTAQAGLTQQANLSNQATQLATGQANLGAATQTNLANLGAAQQTELANLNARLTQQGMDDSMRMQYLGALLGIDARTQQGQLAIQQMLANATLQTQATNAGIGLGNAQNATNLQNAYISGAAALGAAAI